MTQEYIFFPFTHISRNQMDTLQAFFPWFTFFAPATDLKDRRQMQTMVDQGGAMPIFLPADEFSAMNQSFAQYMAWVQVHRGNEHNLRSLLMDSPYFTHDSDVASIKSQIRGKMPAKKAQIPDHKAMNKDLLFLKMAEHWDKENENIDVELKGLEKNRNRMISSLMGTDTPEKMGQTVKREDIGDPGATLTRERVEAWSRCMFHGNPLYKGNGSPIFITTSGAVVDYLETICTEVINALDINPIKVHENDCENITGWQQQVCKQVACAAKGDIKNQKDWPWVNDGCSGLGQIKLTLFSGNNIHHLFHHGDKQIPVCLIRLK